MYGLYKYRRLKYFIRANNIFHPIYLLLDNKSEHRPPEKLNINKSKRRKIRKDNLLLTPSVYNDNVISLIST